MTNTTVDKAQILEILASHAEDHTDNEADAKHSALRMGRCGSPFTYRVFEVGPNNFYVVNHVEAPLYRDLLSALEQA